LSCVTEEFWLSRRGRLVEALYTTLGYRFEDRDDSINQRDGSMGLAARLRESLDWLEDPPVERWVRDMSDRQSSPSKFPRSREEKRAVETTRRPRQAAPQKKRSSTGKGLKLIKIGDDDDHDGW
jgi:hypothetical protein